MSLCKRDVEDRSHTERGDAGAGQLQEVAATDIQAGLLFCAYFQFDLALRISNLLDDSNA